MSSAPVQQKLSSPMRSSWTSAAFIVEAILLLLFLVTSFAVLANVFSASFSRSVESRTLDAAVIAASSTAERFAADPTSIESSAQVGDLSVRSMVTSAQRRAGVMYRAHIEVFATSAAGDEELVYSLDTSSYRSNAPGETGGVHAS